MSKLSILVAATLLFTACGPGQLLGPTLTSTLTITPSPTATYTPFPTNTSTPTLTPTVIPTRSIVSTISPKDGMTMLFIPDGEFSMGSNVGDTEKPIHTVYVDSYWMDQTEVTNDMFAKFVNDTLYTTDAEKSGSSWTYQNGFWRLVNGANWNHPRGPDSNLSGLGDHPVVHVSWYDAKAYCEWRGDGTHLPTEAEWEKAAGWDDSKKEKRVYPWGDTFEGSLLNFCDKNCSFSLSDKSVDDGYEFAAPVAHYPGGASIYGLMDMAGNVWEWVADWYSDTYYASSPSSNPLGPDSGSERVRRGGSWGNFADVSRSSYRSSSNPYLTDFSIGFRCARSQ